MPTLASSASAISVASALLRPRTRRGASMMLSSTVMCGQRLKFWNTKPISLRMRLICRASAATSSPLRACLSFIGSPATTISPSLGFSSRLMQRRKVDFPEPDERGWR